MAIDFRLFQLLLYQYLVIGFAVSAVALSVLGDRCNTVSAVVVSVLGDRCSTVSAVVVSVLGDRCNTVSVVVVSVLVVLVLHWLYWCFSSDVM